MKNIAKILPHINKEEIKLLSDIKETQDHIDHLKDQLAFYEEQLIVLQKNLSTRLSQLEKALIEEKIL